METTKRPKLGDAIETLESLATVLEDQGVELASVSWRRYGLVVPGGEPDIDLQVVDAESFVRAQIILGLEPGPMTGDIQRPTRNARGVCYGMGVHLFGPAEGPLS